LSVSGRIESEAETQKLTNQTHEKPVSGTEDFTSDRSEHDTTTVSDGVWRETDAKISFREQDFNGFDGDSQTVGW